MAQINNQEVMQKLIDELKLYPGKDIIPSELAEKILPTFQVNSQDVIVKSSPATKFGHASLTNVDGLTTKTIYTTPATGDFYLTAFMLQFVHDQTGNRDAELNVVIGGVKTLIAFCRGSTTNANSADPPAIVQMSLVNPILIDKATTITIDRAGANKGWIDGTIHGYVEE